MFTEEAKSSDITNAKHLFSTSIIVSIQLQNVIYFKLNFRFYCYKSSKI